MTNDNIMFIKPGHIAQEVPRIEKLRRLKLEMNDIRMKELGFKSMATSLLTSNKKRKTKNTKATAKLTDLGDDDSDYQPAEDEDALSSHSNNEEEIASTHSRKRSKPIAPHESPPRTEILPSIESIVAPFPTQGSMLVPASMESIPGSESTPACTSKRRGPTRGINTERLIAANGGKKLVVEIPREVGVPVGDNATRFASWVGVQVRVGAPLKEVEKWSDIPSAIKAPIIQATRDKFDVKDYEDEEHVVLAVNRKCQTLFKNWRHKMKKRYQQLVKAGKNPYNTPYRGVKHEDWAWMIDNIWTNNDKEEIAKKKREARADLPFNHSMGSKSFAAAMTAEAKKRGGQRPPTADFFKLSHYNGKTKKWVAPICERIHDQLEANPQEVEVPGLPGSTATTQQEMAVEVDGKKWYLKEYGVSTKQPSKRSTGPSRGEVQVLKNQLETLTQDRQRQDDEMVTLKDLCQRQQEKLSEYDEKFETNSKLIDAQAKKIEQFEAIMSAFMQFGPRSSQ